jgi:membrane protease YdiL (CAAX protease family)
MSLARTAEAPRTGALRTIATAIGSGIAVILAGEAIWIGMLTAYTRHPTPFPWFVPVMAGVLALGAIWMKWGTWPTMGAAARRAGVRLNAVPLRTFLLSLAAGWSTFFAGAGAYIAYRMSSGLGGEVPMTLPPGPKAAIVAGLAMAAIVAGVIEEISVRGFMQGRLEKAFGVAPAIAISGLVWALFHTNHSYFDTSPLDVAIWFGIFLTVSAMLGTIAHRTNSVLPGIAVHAGFDSVYFVSAGLLQPKIAPLAFVESLGTPQEFLIVGAPLAAVAALSWTLLFRATRQN